QQRGAQRLGVETHPGADLGHPDRVNDELLAGLATLVSVVDAGVYERFLDLVTVDRDRRLIRMLLDDREQVRQQPALGLGQLGVGDAGPVALLAHAIDGFATTDERRGP